MGLHTGRPRNPRPENRSWGLSPEAQAVAFKLSNADIQLLAVAAGTHGATIGQASPLVRRLIEANFIRVDRVGAHRAVARITELGLRGVGYWARTRLITVGMGKAP
jgi:hypothetical protein